VADDELPTPVLDRAAGAMLGLAVGDALRGGSGAGSDFEWGDDAELAVGIAEVAATGALDATAVARRLVAVRDAGSQEGRHEAGAVSAVAVAVALAHLGDDSAIVAAALELSSIGQDHPTAHEATVIWSIAIDRAVRDARLDGVWDGVGLLDAAGQRRWTDRLHEAEAEPASAFTDDGSTVRSLQAAWSAIRHTTAASEPRCLHFQHALDAAVRVGNGSDAVAAIAGSLLGARWGSTAVPIRWRALLHGPTGYGTTDLVRLAVLAARRGIADELGWPSAADVTDWYVANYDIQPFEIPLPDDPGVILGNSVSATTADADVVVSLCRIGTDVAARVGEAHEIMVVDSPRRAHNPNLDFVLRDTADAIVAWRDAGQTVFVHCAAGVSRTTAVAAAYLARRLGCSGLEALQRVTAAHPAAQPNEGFVEALERF
jgi:ADP-ribosyl-[dinitrogen reductase] hydrolase